MRTFLLLTLSMAVAVTPQFIPPETPPTELPKGVSGSTRAYRSAVVEVVIVSPDQVGMGSAVVIQRDGGTYWAITCHHVATAGELLFVDGHVCEIVDTSPRFDLALIRFRSENTYPPVQFGQPTIDLETRMIGYCRGTKHTRRGSISHFRKGHRFVMAGGIYPGFSGGAVFSCDGKLVGIMSARRVFYGVPESDWGIAIRGDLAQRWVESVMGEK